MYIKRDLENTIMKYLSTPEIIAVVGARQVGKTTLLEHIRKNTKNSLFLTFEDAEIRTLFNRDIKTFVSLYIQPHKYIFLDEFQYAKEGGKSLKFIYDTVKSKKIFVSGSSILELTVSAVKHLAGRIISFALYPLSYQEFLSYKDQNLYEFYKKHGGKKKLDEVIVQKFYSLLNEFVIYGGYPRVVISKSDSEKKEVLKNLLNIYLLKDVRDILGLTDDYKMFNLIKALSLQIGNIISYQELSAVTQQSFSMLKRYLNLLEKTYIIHLLKPFFTNKRTELVKNPKIYFYDTGLRNAVIGDFKELNMRTDKGALLENFIFKELTKNNHSLKYWRTKSKAEVDFIVDEKAPLEVKSRLSRPIIEKSLLSFIEKYHPENAYVFNENIFDKVHVHRSTVHFLYHFSRFIERSQEG